jgi:putative peptidoglycan lipid II flippase
VKDVLKLSGPLLISQSVLQVNPLIDRSMAAGINSGSVTELELGLRLFFVPAGLIGATLVAPLAATWAARVAEEGEQALSDSVSSAIRAVALIVPPLAVVGLILKTHLITLLYAGGAYTPSALHHTADVFGLLLIGLPANILVVVLATLFIVRRDAIFPMKIAIANVVLNVVLNVLLRPGLGVAGIALSTSLTFIILVCVYAVVAQRRWRTFDFAKLRGPFARAALSAAGIAAAGGAIMLAVPFGDDRAGAVAAIACVGTAALAVHAAVHFIGPGRDWIAFTTRFRATTPRPHG